MSIDRKYVDRKNLTNTKFLGIFTLYSNYIETRYLILKSFIILLSRIE